MAEMFVSRTKLRVMLAEHSDWGLPLAEAALAIASEEYPALDGSAYLRRLDGLAERVRIQLHNPDPREAIRQMNTVLFIDEGYEGAREGYDEPRNFFLNEVMDRRTGSPIGMSILYAEVGRRAGLPLQGVGLPGHFIVRYRGHTCDLFVDPHSEGKLLTPMDCHRMAEQTIGAEIPFDPSMLAPWNHRQILQRVLANLRKIYMEQRDYVRALWVVELLMILEPSWTEGLRERGWLHYKLRCYTRARADLQGYLSLAPNPQDSEKIWGLLAKIREASK